MVAQVITTGNISLAGNLIVTGGGSHPAFAGGYNLINTIGSSVLPASSRALLLQEHSSGPMRDLPTLDRASISFFPVVITRGLTRGMETGEMVSIGAGFAFQDPPASAATWRILSISEDDHIIVTLANPAGNAAFPVDLFQLNLNASTTSYLIEQFSTASTITFSTGSLATPTHGVPQIQVEAGSHNRRSSDIKSAVGRRYGSCFNRWGSAHFSSKDYAHLVKQSKLFRRQSSGSTLGTGLLINNTTLQPYSMAVHSATILNNGEITQELLLQLPPTAGKMRPYPTRIRRLGSIPSAPDDWRKRDDAYPK